MVIIPPVCATLFAFISTAPYKSLQGCSTGYLYWYLELKYWYLYLRHGYWYWYLRLKYWYLNDWVLATTLNHCNYLPEIYWQKWILFSFIKNTLKCSGDHIMFCWLLFNCGFNPIRFSCAFMVIICGTNLCFWRILYYILKDMCLKSSLVRTVFTSIHVYL